LAVILIWWFGGFHLHHQIKIMPFNFSTAWPCKSILCDKKSLPILALHLQVEEANKAVAKVITQV